MVLPYFRRRARAALFFGLLGFLAGGAPGCRLLGNASLGFDPGSGLAQSAGPPSSGTKVVPGGSTSGGSTSGPVSSSTAKDHWETFAVGGAPLTIDISADLSCLNRPCTLVTPKGPSHGSVYKISNTQIGYVPGTMSVGPPTFGPYHGADLFTYDMVDGQGLFFTGTVHLRIMTPMTWTNAGGSGLFNDPRSWCGPVLMGACQGLSQPPDGSQTPVFDGTCPGKNVAGSCDLDEPGTMPTLPGFFVDADFPGTVRIRTDLVVATLGYWQYGGRVTLDGSNMTEQSGDFHLEGGRFDEPATVLLTGRNVYLGSAATTGLRGTFYLKNYSGAMSAHLDIPVQDLILRDFGSAIDVTGNPMVLGDLTLEDTASSTGSTLTTANPISVKGDLYSVGTGFSGPGRISFLSAGGTQSIHGDLRSGGARVPNIDANNSKLTLADGAPLFTGDLVYTPALAGSFDSGPYPLHCRPNGTGGIRLLLPTSHQVTNFILEDDTGLPFYILSSLHVAGDFLASSTVALAAPTLFASGPVTVDGQLSITGAGMGGGASFIMTSAAARVTALTQGTRSEWPVGIVHLAATAGGNFALASDLRLDVAGRSKIYVETGILDTQSWLLKANWWSPSLTQVIGTYPPTGAFGP